MNIALRKPTTLRLNTNLVERLKTAAKRENRSLNNYIESVLMDVMYNEPNETTKMALAEVERGEYAGVVDMTSIETIINSIEG